MKLFLRKVSLRQPPLVERIGNRASPGGVERFPVALGGERRMEVVEEWHPCILLRQALEGSFLFGPGKEVESPDVAGLVGFLGGGVLEDFGKQRRRCFRPAAPDDVPAGWRAQSAVAGLLQVLGEVSVPLLVGGDAERFQVPAVLAVVLGGKLGPESWRLRRLVVPQGDGKLSTD